MVPQAPQRWESKLKYDASTGHIDFPHALTVMIKGRRVRRANWWAGCFAYCADGCFYLRGPTADIEWTPSWDDLLADNWVECV